MIANRKKSFSSSSSINDDDDEQTSVNLSAMRNETNLRSLNDENRGLIMRHGNAAGDDDERPEFNQIRIDLRSGAGKNLNNPNNVYYPRRYPTENDQRSQGSIPSRVSRYSEYPQVRPTNPLYSSQSTLKTLGSNPAVQGLPSSKSSATLVNRRQKFDPQAPRRPSDWRWFAILCIILFFPLGLFAFAFASKAQRKFRDGFILESHQLNKRALILSILSILCGIALFIGLLFGFDAWPRSNG